MSNTLPIEEQVIAALRQITRAIDLHSRLLLQQNGLTIPQLTALRAIKKLQPVTVGGIAKEIHLGSATVTGILDRLQNRGLVSRARGDFDRRSVVVQLTDEGVKLIDEAPSLLQDKFHRELEKLQQWEQTSILATLQRIACMMDAEHIEAAPVLVPGAMNPAPDEISKTTELHNLPLPNHCADKSNDKKNTNTRLLP